MAHDMRQRLIAPVLQAAGHVSCLNAGSITPHKEAKITLVPAVAYRKLHAEINGSFCYFAPLFS
ncbi:hypothetical protein [uncultured Salinisphaera sp.]|uniref:hypothetical protein n=1 Tax=uncultured Salinisphaera sp. TaxID=359372 RepID=UPI0032B28BA4|tara:strand:- start:439 stop:630 length:192 start_codon:yes stop_codon:yes gene_type:complete